jgi:NHS family xanthosine MFS transporter
MIVTGFSALHYLMCQLKIKNSNQTLTSKFGLDSFVLFKQKKWRYFLFCHVWAALQITNMFVILIRDFGSNPEYQGTLGWNTLY